MSIIRKPMIIGLTMLSLCSSCTRTQNQERSIDDSVFGAKKARQIVVCKVISQQLQSETKLPADLLAYRDVTIYPKVPGYVSWLGVDRGSIVKRGELILRLTAPELQAQCNQAQNDAQAAHDEMEQAQSELKSLIHDQAATEAKLKAEEDTLKRLKGASSYPGIISGNDLEIADKQVEADRAKVRSYIERRNAITKRIRALSNIEKAKLASAQSRQDIEAYLRIMAPFDGVITERNVHEGSFVSPPAAGNNDKPMLRVEQLSVLRLVVPVPEMAVSGIVSGASVNFTVPAFPSDMFTGTVRRIGHYLDLTTRTMPVELDVDNKLGRLAPGMFAEVIWPVRRTHACLLVPQSAVATTTERKFVVRIRNSVVQWVNVKTGISVRDMVEVFGDLKEGDVVAVRGTDELREGAHVQPVVSKNL